MPPLNITQFHFVAWPDHGVPDNCAIMLNFVRHVRKLHPYSNPCPLLVHCSAGVGRTGTFIVLDSMLERMKTEDTLNIYDFVKHLRNQRVLMVQTQVSSYRSFTSQLDIANNASFSFKFRLNTYSFMMLLRKSSCVERLKFQLLTFVLSLANSACNMIPALLPQDLNINFM